MKILFANIGWMTHYRGNNAKDQIVGGGSYRNDDKHEAFNFLPINGICYGYARTVKLGGISLNRIDKDYTEKEFLKDVLVVWIAKRPSAGGTYVVGWYNNATVYSTYQKSDSESRNKYTYNIEAKEKDCTLIPIDQRTLLVPRANAQGKGFLGQSNVWYADSTRRPVQQFRKEVVEYIEQFSKVGKRISITSLKVDADARKRVEDAAVAYVTREYQSIGYKVTSREKENVGWDLDAEKNGIKLKLEVKGLAQSQVSVRITDNEFNSMMANKGCYRLCVVTNAIKAPCMIKFIWDESLNAWVSDEDEAIRLSIELKPSYLAVVE